MTAGLGATAGAASGAAGPGRSARRNGETWAGGRGKRRKGPCRCRKPGGGAGPAVLAVSTGGRSGGGGPDGQVGGGRPALDRGAAGGRHQRQQLALVSGRAGTAAGLGGPGGRSGPGTGRHGGRCSLRTERDASNWSTERLKALLLPVRVEGEEGACEVTEVSKLDGEASINNRKGKLIFFYEWAIKLAWTGEWRQLPLFRGRFECEMMDASEVLRCDAVRGCL